ncbi:MAG TPA: carboxypeptidase regulatory-like domain-containing protein [Pyrinomonadaceae bacterium]|nr:carboxypeptidase regulatory-like domain-containing protein [Pyrinomonadaceae bacterium]
MKRLELQFTLVVLLVLSAIGSAAAQTSKGFVTGVVEDQNGAAIANAAVKITNITTGVARETVADSSGSFRLDAVDPGAYMLEASAQGFKTAKLDRIDVNAAQTLNLPIKLEIGSPTEQVVVSATNEVVIQSADGTRVNTLGEREIRDLPVVGLNPVNLVFTLPGVADVGGANGVAGGFVQGTEFSINGLRPRGNNQLIDGLDNNDNSITGQVYQPTVRDAYSQVTVLGGDYSAEFGRAGGAVVNVITRSGSNEFHGSAYDIIQNSAFDALTPGQKSQSSLTEVPQFSQNTFGFSFGGPIIKNKLFFFGTYQADLVRAGAVSGLAVVPTQAGINQLRTLFPVGASPNLDRYLAIVGDLRGTTNLIQVPIGGNRLPIEFGTATRFSPQPVNTYDYLARIDWTTSDKNSLSFRYLANKQFFSNQFPDPSTGIAGSQFPGFEIDVPSLTQNMYISDTYVFSPRTVNEARFGYGRFNLFFGPRDEALQNSGPQFLFSGTTISTVGLSPSFVQGRIFNNFQFQDTLTHTVGNHTLRVGTDILMQRAKQFVPINTRGQLTFAAGGGFPAFGNFLDSFSGVGTGQAAKVFGAGLDYPNVTTQAYFINDTWKIRPNLTLNLGLRYEHFGAVANNAAFPAFTGFDAPLQTRVEQQNDSNNFGPRFSFAYSPNFGSGWPGKLFGQDQTVIRGGFAINYDVFFNNILSNIMATSPNALGTTVQGAPLGGRGIPNFTEASLPSTLVANPQAGQNTIPSDLKNPQTYVWNFGIQRELPGRNVLDVAYVGTRGTRLFINEQLNPGIPGSTNANGRAFATRGSVVSRTNGGDSHYHSLQARVERSFRNNFLYRATYTFQKTIDNTNSEIFATTGGNSVGSNAFDRSVDVGVADFDVPHIFTFSGLWDIPAAGTGFWKSVTGGFQLAGIWRYQSGNVSSPFVTGIDLNGDLSGTNDRPSIANPLAPATSVGFANSLAGGQGCGVSATGFFDINCNPVTLSDVRYLVDPSIRTNIAGRNTLRAPAYNTFDLSLQRSFNLPFTPMEQDRFEIRFEYFNVFNTPIFRFEVGGFSDGDVTNENFNRPDLNSGVSVGATGARSGRLQLRYVF